MNTHAGVAPERRGSAVKTAVGIWTAATALCVPFLVAVPAASAAVPAFPDNLVVFPDRDFITVEGYQDRIGQTATIEVTRPGVGVIGSAQSEIAEGDVAFEINHPGGVCWGAGTDLKVTPDIQHGDEVSIKFDGQSVGDTKVLGVYVTGTPVLDGNRVTIKGHIDAGLNPAQIEQRIVEPALKDTSVGRRDARAVPGGTGDDGYTSSLVVDGTNWTATYVFDQPEAARIAANAGAGVRAMSWQVADVDDNRQGLTIAEYGEVGGAGMGGCPTGPHESGPVAPTDVTAAKTEGSVKLTWTPAKAVPGTPAITGYRVHAVAQTAIDGEKAEIGKRIDNVAAKGTTISGLDPDAEYDISIVSLSSAGETFPAATATPVVDGAAPNVSASLATGSFRTAQQLALSSTENGAEIYYTIDESDVVESGGLPSQTADLYTAPIDIAETTTVNFVAIDPSGNRSAQGSVKLTITNDPLPAKPAAPSAVASKGSATVTWTAPDAGGSALSITGYSVQAYQNGAKVGAAKTAAGGVTTLEYGGLTGDTDYQFTVSAANENGPGEESDKSAAVMVLGPVVANAGPDQTINRQATATVIQLDGSRSTRTGATYKWTQKSGDTLAFNRDDVLNPRISLPVFDAAKGHTNNPLVFTLTVTAGGTVVTDEVRLTPVPDRVTATASWKSRDFRIQGTGSVVGATITIRRAGPTGPVVGRVPVTAAVAPETGGVWTLRLRDNNAGTTNPGTLWIQSNVGSALTTPVTARSRPRRFREWPPC
jgi:hypothetical protein